MKQSKVALFEIKSNLEKMSAEFNKCPVVEQTIQRVADDPYSENVTHGGLHPSSLSKIIENIFGQIRQKF